MPGATGCVVLLMPREQYILARFLGVCCAHGFDATIALEQPQDRRWQLVSYRAGHYVTVDARDGACEAGLPPLRSSDGGLGIVPTSEFSVQPAELLAHRLGLFHNPLAALPAYRDKLAMRQACGRAGAAQPRVLARFAALAEVDGFDWAQVAFPAIVKPRDLTSSVHVRLCQDRHEARQALRRVFLHGRSFAGGTFSGQGLLESYAPGPEFSAECVVRGGRLAQLYVTTKFVSPLPACDEIGHVAGAPVGADHLAAARRLCEQVVRAWDTEAGVLHVEYKFDGQRCVLMEAACRIGGDHISELVELQHGASLEAELVALRCPALGFEPPCGRPAAGFHGIRFLFGSSRRPRAAEIEVLRRVRYDRPPENSRGFALNERLGYELVHSRSLAAILDYVGTDCAPNVHLAGARA